MSAIAFVIEGHARSHIRDAQVRLLPTMAMTHDMHSLAIRCGATVTRMNPHRRASSIAAVSFVYPCRCYAGIVHHRVIARKYRDLNLFDAASNVSAIECPPIAAIVFA